VTHDLNLAGQYASRVVLLDRGRIAAEGPVEEVLRREVLEPVYGSRSTTDLAAVPARDGRTCSRGAEEADAMSETGTVVTEGTSRTSPRGRARRTRSSRA
jgi:ABC-type glutathione transport system ATPase component